MAHAVACLFLLVYVPNWAFPLGTETKAIDLVDELNMVSAKNPMSTFYGMVVRIQNVSCQVAWTFSL